MTNKLPTSSEELLRKNKQLWSAAMAIVNKCGETWAVPVADRQQWNDELDIYVMREFIGLFRTTILSSKLPKRHITGTITPENVGTENLNQGFNAGADAQLAAILKTLGGE